MSAFYFDKISQLATDLSTYQRLSNTEYAGLSTKHLAQLMHDMNCEALGQRYGDDPIPFKFEECKRSSTLKSKLDEAIFHRLSCYLYQCSEGDVPDHPLYKALRDIQNSIAYRYMKDNNKAPFEWGE